MSYECPRALRGLNMPSRYCIVCILPVVVHICIYSMIVCISVYDEHP